MKGSFVISQITSTPSLTDLTQHFQEKGQSSEDSTLLSEITGHSYVSILDEEITIEEIVDANKRSKRRRVKWRWAGKTNGNKCSNVYDIHIIYNTIFNCRMFPTVWRTTIVMENF